MNRRSFIEQTSKAAAALPFLSVPAFLQRASMGIVVHSYGIRWNSKIDSDKYPAFSNALELIEHCHQIGAGGVQVSVRNWTNDFSKKVRDKRERLGLFLEGSIGLPKNEGEKGIFEQEVIAAREAGATVLRTVCLGGRRYETFHSQKEFDDFKKKSVVSLQLAESVVRKHKVRLAIENHKDWRANELVEILQNLNSEWVGATLDFGNSIALMEHPLESAEALAPFAFSTHVKDMGVKEYPDGFLLSEVPLGLGLVDLQKLCSLCTKHNPGIRFNLEMITRDPLKIPCLTQDYWSTFQGVSGVALANTLQMVRQNPYKTSLPEVSGLTGEQRLDFEEQNILTSLVYSKSHLRPG